MRPFFGGTTNVYPLETPEGWLLVDTGYDRDEHRFLQAMGRRGIRLEDVAYVLLTHHHDDHSGLVVWLTDLNPAIRVIAHERSLPLLEVGQNDLTHGGFWLNGRVRALARVKKWLTPAWDLRFPPYRRRDDDIVIRGERDDQTLRDLGVAGSLLATPGHTIDSMSVVLDTGEGLVGDAAAAFLGFAGTNHCVVFLTDLDAYYQSWDRLLEAGVQVVCPAHGRAFSSAVLAAERGRNPASSLIPFTGL